MPRATPVLRVPRILIALVAAILVLAGCTAAAAGERPIAVAISGAIRGLVGAAG